MSLRHAFCPADPTGQVSEQNDTYFSLLMAFILTDPLESSLLHHSIRKYDTLSVPLNYHVSLQNKNTISFPQILLNMSQRAFIHVVNNLLYIFHC